MSSWLRRWTDANDEGYVLCGGGGIRGFDDVICGLVWLLLLASSDNRGLSMCDSVGEGYEVEPCSRIL